MNDQYLETLSERQALTGALIDLVRATERQNDILERIAGSLAGIRSALSTLVEKEKK